VCWGAEQGLKEMGMSLQEMDDAQEVLNMSFCEYLPWHLPPCSEREAEAVL